MCVPDSQEEWEEGGQEDGGAERMGGSGDDTFELNQEWTEAELKERIGLWRYCPGCSHDTHMSFGQCLCYDPENIYCVTCGFSCHGGCVCARFPDMIAALKSERAADLYSA